MNNIILNDGNSIPDVGFGTYKAGKEAVLDAIAVGYRLIDTAKVYNNEEEVGSAIKQSGISRDELIITSKLDRNMLGYENARSELEKTLKRLGIDYIDLYLLHWPRPDFGSDGFDDWMSLDIESWNALEEMQKEGKIRSIGVSNFLPCHLLNLIEHCNVLPSVNQLELHPGYMQTEALAFCKERNILLEAWSPTARGRLSENDLLCDMAAKYNTDVSHLCLVYLHKMGIVPLPKSVRIEKMKSNMSLDDIAISCEDINMISEMPVCGWGGEHPDRKRVYF